MAGVVCIFMATLEVRFGTSPSPAPPTGYKGLSVEEEAEFITTLSAILETDAVVAAKFDGYQPLQMLLNAGPLVLLFAPVKDDTGAVSGELRVASLGRVQPWNSVKTVALTNLTTLFKKNVHKDNFNQVLQENSLAILDPADRDVLQAPQAPQAVFNWVTFRELGTVTKGVPLHSALMRADLEGSLAALDNLQILQPDLSVFCSFALDCFPSDGDGKEETLDAIDDGDDGDEAASSGPPGSVSSAELAETAAAAKLDKRLTQQTTWFLRSTGPKKLKETLEMSTRVRVRDTHIM